MAANTLDAVFPEIWAAEGLITLHNEFVMAALVHRDFEATISAKGKSVHTRQPQTFTAQSKALGSDYSDTALNPTDVEILLNKHEYVSFIIEDVEAAKSHLGMQGILEDNVRPAAKALAFKVDSDLLALESDLSNAVGTAGTDLTNLVMIDAIKKLNDNKVPGGMRRGVIASKDHANLLKGVSQNSIFVQAEQRGDSTGFKDAIIGRAYGVDWFMTQGIKMATVSSVLNTKNMVFHRNAFALVTRGLPPVDGRFGVISVTQVMDGLSLRLNLSYDPKRGGAKAVFEVLYGVKTLNEVLAVRLLT